MLIRSTIASITVALVAVVGSASSALADDLPPFEDLDGAHHADAVTALAEEHLITGCDDAAFCPSDALTRGQFATILAAVMERDTDEAEVAIEPDHLITGEVEPEPMFGDVAGTTHDEAIITLAQAGFTAGCNAEDFCPDESVTRAQMATLLSEVFDLPEVEESFFDDTTGVHAESIDRLAASGIAAGCGEPLTAYCPDRELRRSHVAMFIARAMDFVPRTEIASLEDRRAEQAEIDAQREAEEEARRQAEEEARRQAEEERRQAEEEAARQAAEEAAAREAAANSAQDQNWRNLAQCESGMNQRAYNSAGPYYGYFQFNIGTWQSVGMTGDPRDHSWDQQLAAAKRLHADRGWGPWPACSRKLGLL